MIDIVAELLHVDRFGRDMVPMLSPKDVHPVCMRAADEIQRLRAQLAMPGEIDVPDATRACLPTWRAGLDDLSRELLSILAHIQTAATMGAVLADDPEEQAAWEAVRDKAAEGAQVYRKARYPVAADQQAD